MIPNILNYVAHVEIKKKGHMETVVLATSLIWYTYLH